MSCVRSDKESSISLTASAVAGHCKLAGFNTLLEGGYKYAQGRTNEGLSLRQGNNYAGSLFYLTTVVTSRLYSAARLGYFNAINEPTGSGNR